MGGDLEDTYEQQLERMLTATGMRVEVLNFGVIGHGAWQHYEMLKRRALACQPDLVVLALFADDFAMSTPPYERSPDYRGQNPFEKKGVRGVMDRFALRNFLKHAHALFEYKYRYRQERYMRNIPKRKKQLTSDNPDNPLYRIIAGKLGKRKYLEFSDMIKRFVSTADAAGANVLIVMIPDSVQLNEPHLQFSSRYAAKVAQETEVPFVDVTPILEAQADHKSLYLFPFDAHNSPRGLRIIAKAIADKIFEFGLLDSTQEQAPQRRQESAVGDLSGGRV